MSKHEKIQEWFDNVSPIFWIAVGIVIGFLIAWII